MTNKNTSSEIINSDTSKSVFIISKSQTFLDKIKNLLKDFTDFKYTQFQDIENFLDLDPATLSPYLFLVDGTLGIDLVNEWTQTLKMSYTSIPLVVFYSYKSPLDFVKLKKNGTDLIVHLNFDKEFIIDLLFEIIPYSVEKNFVPLSALSSIQKGEISPELEVNFDVYVHLPNNQKTILFRRKGSRIEESQLKNVENHDQKLYFKKSEKKQFFEYARASQSLSSEGLGYIMTEKNLKTKKIIFEIISSFFSQQSTDYQEGKDIFEKAKKIILEYSLLDPLSPKDAFDKMFSLAGQNRTFYTDAINICNYSALFGCLLEKKSDQIEALALAGLFHNVGLSGLDDFEVNQDVSSLTKEDQEWYYSYPEKSVLMIKNKKVPIPDVITKAIQEHRENSDGTGFPKKLDGSSISELAKIVRIAYEFQVRSSLTPNQAKLTPQKAFEEIKEGTMSGKLGLDLTLVLSLHKFLQQTSKAS